MMASRLLPTESLVLREEGCFVQSTKQPSTTRCKQLATFKTGEARKEFPQKKKKNPTNRQTGSPRKRLAAS